MDPRIKPSETIVEPGRPGAQFCSRTMSSTGSSPSCARSAIPSIEASEVPWPDPYWNVVLALVESHLEDRPIDLTGLIDASGAAYGTGNRLVAKMVEAGPIVRVPRGRATRPFLRPSEALLDEFAAYATEVKALLARTFGLRSGAEADEYYLAGPILRSDHSVFHRRRHRKQRLFENFRFLLERRQSDFTAMRNRWSRDFRTDISRRSSFDFVVGPITEEALARSPLATAATTSSPSDGLGSAASLRPSRSRRSTSIARPGD